MKNNASLVYNACLVVGDFLALAAAFVVAYILRVKLAVGISNEAFGPLSGRTYVAIFLTVLPFWILIFALLGLYNHSIYEKRFKELGRLLLGSFFGLLLLIFWSFIASEPLFPARLVPIYGFAFGFLFLVIFRNIARFVRSRLFGYNIGLTRVLLVGNTAMTRELLNTLADSRKSGYKVVGVVGGKQSMGEHHNTPLCHSFDQFLEKYKGELHSIIQTELYADEARNAKILSYAQEHHISYRFVPGNTELFVGNIVVELFRGSVPVIAVHQTALFGWGRIVKRMSDVLLGSTALVLTSPLMLMIALFEMLSGSGSVFFRQERLTRFNRKFKVFKFRSQYKKYDGTTPEEAFAMMGRSDMAKEYRENGDALPDDPRITPLGKLLRATSLDELPQLINVVKGDISLVGPRALIPEELAAYSKRHAILSVKSGLTGLAQVSGRRDLSFEDRRRLDLYYVQNWSIWLDLAIILKTIRAVFAREGAK
ncbi:MAG TPA: sugar transferase [Candidatus Saccharimonadales bacterium]|nr:sugar transferase [Candidatus Saccharimonadales bacterium]